MVKAMEPSIKKLNIVMAYKPTMDDIKKLRTMTGAGLGDVKKALVEAEGDFDKAKDLLRERGLAIAAKRSDRETSNGCVLVRRLTASQLW